MLDLMRKHAQSWIIKAALGGIIVVFVFFFGWSDRSDDTKDYAAKVNDTVISDQEFRVVLDSEMEKLRLRFKGGIPPGLLEKLNLKEKVINRMVDQLLLFQEAGRLGFFVTDQDVVQDIRSNPMFQGGGAFDERLYREFLRQVKLSAAFYEEVRRRELLEGQVVRLLTDSVKASPEEIKSLWHFQQDKLVLSVLMIKPEPEAGPPDPAALESFFLKNQSKYEFPPSVNIKYVAFSWQDLRTSVSAPDEEVSAYYQNHSKEFIIPERIRARHILLKVSEAADKDQVEAVRKKVEEIQQKIKGGEDFTQVAQTESQDETTASKGGELGLFSRGTMNPSLEKAAAALEVGEISDPVRTDQGFHILKVEERQQEKQLEFDLVKNKIVDKIVEEKARKKAEQIADELYELAYRADDVQAPATKLGLPVQDVQMVTKSAGIPQVGADLKIMDEVFRLQAGEISKLVRSGDTFVLVKVISQNKERVPPLEEIKGTVEDDFRKDQALQNARSTARRVIDSLKEQPDNFEERAQQLGVLWQHLEPVSRTSGMIPQLGESSEASEMLSTISPANPVFGSPIPITGGAAVVRLAKVEQANEEKFAGEGQAFENWILQVRKTDFLKGWLKRLRDRGKVDVSSRLL